MNKVERDAVSRLLTMRDVAERLQVDPRTVRRWAKAGLLHVHRTGRLVRVAEDDLQLFLLKTRT